MESIVRLDLDRRLVERADGQVERLTTLEAALLRYLQQADRAVTRDELLAQVWGYAPTTLSRVCDTTIRRLRVKLEVDPAAPELLITVYGTGYRLLSSTERSSAPVEVPARAPAGAQETRWRLGDRWVDLGRARIDGPDGRARLTANELAVLQVLLEAEGVTVDRDVLQRRIWGNASGRALESTVARLRSKLEPDRAHPQFLLTTARGYRMELGVSDTTAPSAPSPVLPAEVDARFGREDEVAAVLERLAAGDRVVTVTGTGGVGKTRVALAVARRLPLVWWLDLVDSRSVDRMALAAAQALGVRLTPGDPVVAVGVALAGLGEAVVVLDNVEQLMPDAAAAVMAWARRAEAVRFVVTSRVPLGIRGERRVPVGPLPLPDAVALFLDRAVRPPGAAELTEVEQLVEAMDRLPLAIELAAARTSALSVGEIRRRTDDRLRLLVVADPTRPERHRSLRASLDGSWAMLSPSARQAAAQLAVFAGSFGIEAIEAVVALPDGDWTIDAVQELVDAGFVRSPLDTGRYSLPMVVQEYLAEQLTGEGRLAAEVRHGRAFAALGELPRLWAVDGPHEIESRRALGQELDNLLVATERAFERGDAGVVVRTASAAWEVLQNTGSLRLASGWGRRLVEMGTRGADQVIALKLAARIEESRGQLQVAEELLLDAAGLVDGLDHPALAATVHALRASYLTFRERLDEAEAEARQALALARQEGAWGHESWALQVLARGMRFRGRMDEARELAWAARDTAARAGSRGRLFEALRELAALPGPAHERTRWLQEAAQAARDRGDRIQEADAACALLLAEHRRYRAGAADALEAYVGVYRRMGDRLREAATLLYVGIARTASLQLDRAEGALRAAQAFGEPTVTEAASWRLAAVSLLRGDTEAAEPLLQAALATQPTGARGASVRLLVGMAQEQRGQWAAARATWEALAVSESSGEAGRAEALVLLGRQAADRGDRGSAEVSLQDALRLATDGGFEHLQVRAAGRLAVLAAQRGATREAEGHLQLAAERVQEMGHPAWPSVDLALAEAEVAQLLGQSGQEALDRADQICAATHPGHEQRLRGRLRARAGPALAS
jgi:predicted ATPase/DNA-binding response OmpR family regulator